ncbi:DUF883 family protein [Parendozoicomonas haliclonae]|uniref:Uncharacterized protein n=1 Tax=Parendozoicomonas haliclonae TaxID=1960125 RepID=A0A1X7APC7_9GAMM|nr:DUF883 family protein [Parendozoicomonas haliclonae]SMA49102.1 hypothetical protein EHSB41UT_03052 [Parendozoicomonas haliclonae]
MAAGTPNPDSHPHPDHGLKAKAHEAFDSAAHRASSAEHYVRDHVGEAAHRLHDKEREMERALRDSADRVRHYAGQHPLMTVGVAFGAGILLTLLLRRH